MVTVDFDSKTAICLRKLARGLQMCLYRRANGFDFTSDQLVFPENHLIVASDQMNFHENYLNLVSDQLYFHGDHLNLLSD